MMQPFLRRMGQWLVAALMCVAAVMVAPAHAQEPEPDVPPLAQPGPYGIGVRAIVVVDDSRDGRELEIVLWYPALAGPDSYDSPVYEGVFDVRDAPYPLIIYSHYGGGDALATLGAGPHLASYGFVVVSIGHEDPGQSYANTIHRPLDVLFVLNELAAATALTPEPLIDTDRVGVTGYSAGGVTTLMVGGAQIDPDYLKAWCAEPENARDLPCDMLAEWDALTELRARFDTLEEGELWPPTTDPRIQAIVPMSPCHGPMFGVDGLAAVTIPTLLIGAQLDLTCWYERDIIFIYDHLGTTDPILITLAGVDHYLPTRSQTLQRVMNHFATAFFGYHLQGREDYAAYLTPESTAEIQHAIWGPAPIE